MKKIGLMGGTFNPVHNGHLILAKQAYLQAHLDEVWFLPSKCPPHKEIANRVSGHHRYQMLELAIRGYEYFRLSDLELLRKGMTYTCQTLTYLNSLPSDNQFYFIMGADSLFQMETWREPSIILQNAVILAACRDDYDKNLVSGQIAHLKGKYDHCQIELISYPRIRISSSKIRKCIKEHQDVSEMIPEAVNCYIKEHGLYENV